jgi:hypothetical protein
MDGPRRSDRKRTQTQFLWATETLGGAGRDHAAERRAREAAVASAYEPLVGLKQLGAAGGGKGRVWVGADGSSALPGFAPTPAQRQRFLDLVQQYTRSALSDPVDCACTVWLSSARAVAGPAAPEQGSQAEGPGEAWEGEAYEPGRVRGVVPSYLKFAARLARRPDQVVRCAGTRAGRPHSVPRAGDGAEQRCVHRGTPLVPGARLCL